MSKVARHLHLAFKGMETEEVYDVLMEHLVVTIKGYDPHYKAKVKLVVEKAGPRRRTLATLGFRKH